MFQCKLWVAALAAAIPANLEAQSCPVRVQAVTIPTAGSPLLRITYRNTGRFPIRGVEFRAQGVNGGGKPSHVARILAFGHLGPDQTKSVFWNRRRFEKKSAADPSILIWPALVEMGDSSVWRGNAAECSMTVDKATLTTKQFSPRQKTPTPKAQDIQTLVSQGRASIVRIISDPSGAEVDIGDWRLGVTPITFALLSSQDGGPRSITVSKPGYTLAGHDVAPNGKPFSFDDRLLPLPK